MAARSIRSLRISSRVRRCPFGLFGAETSEGSIFAAGFDGLLSLAPEEPCAGGCITIHRSEAGDDLDGEAKNRHHRIGNKGLVSTRCLRPRLRLRIGRLRRGHPFELGSRLREFGLELRAPRRAPTLLVELEDRLTEQFRVVARDFLAGFRPPPHRHVDGMGVNLGLISSTLRDGPTAASSASSSSTAFFASWKFPITPPRSAAQSERSFMRTPSTAIMDATKSTRKVRKAAIRRIAPRFGVPATFIIKGFAESRANAVPAKKMTQGATLTPCTAKAVWGATVA